MCQISPVGHGGFLSVTFPPFAVQKAISMPDPADRMSYQRFVEIHRRPGCGTCLKKIFNLEEFARSKGLPPLPPRASGYKLPLSIRTPSTNAEGAEAEKLCMPPGEQLTFQGTSPMNLFYPGQSAAEREQHVLEAKALLQYALEYNCPEIFTLCTMGGFIYIDARQNICAINALMPSTEETGALYLGKPRSLTPYEIEWLFIGVCSHQAGEGGQGCAPVTANVLREAGAVFYDWVSPTGESLRKEFQTLRAFENHTGSQFSQNRLGGYAYFVVKEDIGEKAAYSSDDIDREKSCFVPMLTLDQYDKMLAQSKGVYGRDLFGDGGQAAMEGDRYVLATSQASTAAALVAAACAHLDVQELDDISDGDSERPSPVKICSELGIPAEFAGLYPRVLCALYDYLEASLDDGFEPDQLFNLLEIIHARREDLGSLPKKEQKFLPPIALDIAMNHSKKDMTFMWPAAKSNSLIQLITEAECGVHRASKAIAQCYLDIGHLVQKGASKGVFRGVEPLPPRVSGGPWQVLLSRIKTLVNITHQPTRDALCIPGTPRETRYYYNVSPCVFDRREQGAHVAEQELIDVQNLFIWALKNHQLNLFCAFLLGGYAYTLGSRLDRITSIVPESSENRGAIFPGQPRPLQSPLEKEYLLSAVAARVNGTYMDLAPVTAPGLLADGFVYYTMLSQHGVNYIKDSQPNVLFKTPFGSYVYVALKKEARITDAASVPRSVDLSRCIVVPITGKDEYMRLNPDVEQQRAFWRQAERVQEFCQGVFDPGQAAAAADPKGNTQCVVCLDGYSDARPRGAVVPCGHAIGHVECLTQCKESQGKCPTCRKVIQSVMRVFQ